MFDLSTFNQIGDYEWEIPQSFRPDMRVSVRIFATRELLEATLGDKSLEQAINAATLPGLAGSVVVMPDVHQGYGFPIGGVAATRYPDGVISPGAIGYDINCGVRLLGSSIELEAARDRLDDLATALNHYCPSGVGSKGAVRLSEAELDQICRQGSHWTLKKGWATEQDLRRTEEYGSLGGADPDKVSSRAKERGRAQLGTLGAGNHFIEVDVVDQIFDDLEVGEVRLGGGDQGLDRGIGRSLAPSIGAADAIDQLLGLGDRDGPGMRAGDRRGEGRARRDGDRKENAGERTGEADEAARARCRVVHCGLPSSESAVASAPSAASVSEPRSDLMKTEMTL